MTKILTSFFCIIVCTSFGQSDKAKKVLTQVFEHAKEASLYRNQVDWERAKIHIESLSQNADSIVDLKPAFDYLLSELSDEHGRVIHNNKVLSFFRGPVKPHRKEVDSDIYANIQSGQFYQFEAKALDEEVAYVRIVGIPMGDNIEMSQAIQQQICPLVKKGFNKWMVDLRYNGGGNLFPMAEGLAVIIGNGHVGGSKGHSETENSIWTIKNGDFYYDDFTVNLPNDCKCKRLPKVAVLTSIYTASSGEALAVMFKGREETKFFGGSTLGMVTVTDWNVIDEKTAMTISVSYYQDRNGKVYEKYIPVDEQIPFAEIPLSENDEASSSAINWLNAKK